MTFSLDYRPRRDGKPYDPVAYGGAVDLVRVFSTPDRNATPIAQAGPAVRVEFGLYRFTLPDLPDGTYYTAITWTEAAGATPYTDLNDRFVLPVPDPQIARLRRLIGEPDPVGAYTDADLVLYLEQNTHPDGYVDVYAAAADVWEEKAGHAAATEAAGGRQVQAVTTGGQSVTYAAGQGAAGPAAQARYFRARSRGRSVQVLSPRSPHLADRMPEQVDAGLGHLYGT